MSMAHWLYSIGWPATTLLHTTIDLSWKKWNLCLQCPLLQFDGCNLYSCSVDGARLRGIWEGPRRLTSVSLSSHLDRLFTIIFVYLVASHGRVPAAVLRPNSMQGRLMRVKVPHAPWASQCDLRDPGWGDPGFRHCWSACVCTFTAILLWCLVGLCCFLQDL